MLLLLLLPLVVSVAVAVASGVVPVVTVAVLGELELGLWVSHLQYELRTEYASRTVDPKACSRSPK